MRGGFTFIFCSCLGVFGGDGMANPSAVVNETSAGGMRFTSKNQWGYWGEQSTIPPMSLSSFHLELDHHRAKTCLGIPYFTPSFLTCAVGK